MSRIHNCRICGGNRPCDEKHCLGCGTELVRCKAAKLKRNWNECPACTHTGPHKLTSDKQFRCQKCGATFEGPDFNFVDDRPDVNVDKKDRLADEIKKRRQKL